MKTFRTLKRKHIQVQNAQRVPHSSVQFLSHVQLFATPWIADARLPCPSLTPGVYSNPFNHLIICCPLLLLPSIFPSIRVFSTESFLPIRWPKYQSFVFNIGPSNEHPGLISLRMDWLDLLAVQGPLKSLLQHHTQFKSINSSALSFLYGLCLIHDYWKNHSFDQMDLCWQSNISAFQYAIQVGHNFPSKE